MNRYFPFDFISSASARYDLENTTICDSMLTPLTIKQAERSRQDDKDNSQTFHICWRMGKILAKKAENKW